MPLNLHVYTQLSQLKNGNGEPVQLVAVSKTKPLEDLLELYDAGHRDFGENYVQELAEKQQQMPADTKWHFLGHLQTNKVKHIAPFVYLIQSVDSFKLLQEINKQAIKNNRVINCLLQMHVAQEETKFGFSVNELNEILQLGKLNSLQNICIKGVMGMASFVDDAEQIHREFHYLYNTHLALQMLQKQGVCNNLSIDTISFGMSNDYKIAIKQYSNMIRIGSLLFGERDYSKK